MTAPVKTSIVPATPSYQKTPLTEKQAIALGLPHTSKAKCRLGVNDDREVLWVPMNMSLYDHQNLLALAKGMDIPAYELMARVCGEWFDKNREAIYAEAESHIKAEASMEDLEKKIAALQANLARTISSLQLKKKDIESDDSAE